MEKIVISVTLKYNMNKTDFIYLRNVVTFYQLGHRGMAPIYSMVHKKHNKCK